MKHFISKTILLCLCLFAGIKASADYAEIDGICYNLNKSKKTATVTYYSEDGITKYDHYSGSVVIPEKITSDWTYTVVAIGTDAFTNCLGLTSVTIPNTVERIDGHAFQDCI